MATPTPETAAWLALKARVASLSLSPALPVSYPNEKFDPPSDTDGPTNYLEVSLLKNDPLVATMGTTGKTRHRGILQIVLHARKREHPLAVYTEIAGDIAEHFKLDTVMTNNGVNVRIEAPPTVGNDFSPTDAPLMQIPISIRWNADANRS